MYAFREGDNPGMLEPANDYPKNNDISSHKDANIHFKPWAISNGNPGLTGADLMKKQKYLDQNFGIIKKVHQPFNIIAHEPVPYHYEAFRVKQINYDQPDKSLVNNNSNNNVRLSGNYQPSSLNQYNNNTNIPNNQNIRVSSLNKTNISGPGPGPGPGLFINQSRNAVEEDYIMGRNSQDLMKIDKKY